MARPRNPLKRLRYKPTLDELVGEMIRRDARWVASEASWRQRRERNWWSLHLGRANHTELLNAYYDAKAKPVVLTVSANEPPAGPPSVDKPWTRPGARSRLSDLASLCLARGPLPARV